MVLRLMEEKKPLTHVVFYDTGMEYGAIYRNVEKMAPLLDAYGATFKILKPDHDFLFDMFLKPVNEGTENERYGYDWCGGKCRWHTKNKVRAIGKYLKTIGEYQQYIGIAADEPMRIKDADHKSYPLVEWGMTESDCLAYCYEKGWDWMEDGVELYEVLDRVSCWCCANKNTKELRNMYHFLPKYFRCLKAMQSRIDRPFHQSRGMTIFDYERKFQAEDAQMSIFDLLGE